VSAKPWVDSNDDRRLNSSGTQTTNRTVTPRPGTLSDEKQAYKTDMELMAFQLSKLRAIAEEIAAYS